MENEKGDPINDPIDISNNINDYFANVANSILEQRKYTGDGNFEKYLTNPLSTSISAAAVDASEVAKIISKFKTNKASGPISIPVDIFKFINNDISPLLTKIINISMNTGIHPDKLKIAKVTPIFKKGSKLKASNYRPISLLSNINKIFEKVIYSRVYSFLNEHDCFYELQYGFRANFSTEYALINITQKIKETLDSHASSINRK